MARPGLRPGPRRASIPHEAGGLLDGRATRCYPRRHDEGSGRSATPSAGARLIRERAIRLLACEFRVSADGDEVLARLGTLTAGATQRYPVSSVHRLAARRAHDGYRVLAPGRPPETCPDASAAARSLYWRMHMRALTAMAEFTRLHAACASRGGRRLLAAGPPRSGKSTLMARLLSQGVAVHCDDLVLLRRGEVVPYPRRLFLRPGTLAMIPRLAALPPPFEWDGWEPGSVALDPTEVGFEWLIEPGPVDVVVFLELDPGSPARLEPCPRYRMAELLMMQSTQPVGGPGEWARDVSALLDRAACYVLRSGDLDGSVAAIETALGCSA